jgi:hypothetical protein
VRTPPHLIRWENGRPRRPDADASDDFDYRMLMGAPAEALQRFQEKRLEDSSTSDACAWLDPDSRKCCFYEFPLEVCRKFEMGSEYCRLLRGKML